MLEILYCLSYVYFGKSYCLLFNYFYSNLASLSSYFSYIFLSYYRKISSFSSFYRLIALLYYFYLINFMISSLILNSKRSIVARFCSIPLFSSNFDASKSKSPSLSYLSKIWTIESPIFIHYWSFNSLPIFIALKAMAFIRKLWYRTIKISSKKFKYFTYRSIYNFACFFCPR